MEAAMKIAVILTAFDKMSSVVNNAMDNAETKMRKLMSKKFVEGGAMMTTGVALAKTMQPAVEAFAKLEDANTSLQVSMMDSTGAIDRNFEKVQGLAESLGDLLPGATKDFDEMFEVMMNNGVKSQSILDGVGRAASFLAVDLKMPFNAAGEFAARMKVATGVADSEMLKFMDTISRVKALGIGVDEMQYAFSRSAGTLKMLGLQGLQSSKDMSILFATLIRGGMSGETAATSFNNIIQNVLDPKKWAKFQDMAKANGLSFQMFDKEGKFLGVENMVSQLDKMKALATTKKAQLVMALTGGGSDAQALNAIITNGAEGYARMRAEMEKKASLNDKVNAKLKTLNALWEATTGTIENMLAAIGAGLAPMLKPIVDMIGKVAGTLKVWFSENPRLAQFLSMFVSLTAAAFAIGGVIKVIQGIRIAMQLLNITMKANPFILFATIAITVVSLIYAYWDKIGPFFKGLWNSIKAVFSSTWNWIKNLFLNYTPQGLVIKHWSKIVAFFSNLWERVKGVFLGFIKWYAGLYVSFYNAGKNMIISIWNGIKAFVNKPIEAVKNMVGKIRRLLPFSPAKEGPLMDIHKIRLVETIAESIKPNSLVDKMRHVAQLTFGVMNNGPGGRSLSPVASRGQMVISPTFNFHLSGSATKQDANMLGKEMERQFSQLMKKYRLQQDRKAF